MLKKNPNIVDIKSVITEHPKTSKKLSKTIGNGEKVSSNNSLYIDPNIQKNLDEKVQGGLLIHSLTVLLV